MNRFENAVEALVKGYNEGTLEFGNYCACAVGNIIANSMGINIVEKEDMRPDEVNIFTWESGWNDNDNWWDAVQDDNPRENAFKQMETIGYSLQEIYLIEKAFESQFRGEWRGEEDMYNGMMAVVDVLMELEENNGNKVESPKHRFNKEEVLV